MTDKQEEIRKKLEELGIKLTPEDMEKALVKFRELGKGNIDRTNTGEAMTDRLSKEDALDLIYGSEPENEHAREAWQEMRNKLGGIIDRIQPDNSEIIKKVESELCDLIKNMKFTDAKYVVLMDAKANKILSILKGES